MRHYYDEKDQIILEQHADEIAGHIQEDVDELQEKIQEFVENGGGNRASNIFLSWLKNKTEEGLEVMIEKYKDHDDDNDEIAREYYTSNNLI
jgi:quinol monooxygenase YgiN